jgi:glucose-6-phosphate-specific signal transduction histidine kinase
MTKNRNTAYWLCQLIGWSLYSTIGVLIASSQVGWRWSIVLDYAIFFVVVVLLTDLLRQQIRQRQWLTLPLWKSAPRLFLAASITGLCSAMQVTLVGRLSGGASAVRPGEIFWLTFGIVSACIMWTVFYVAITATRRAVEMRVLLRDAQLRALEAQVNPHFLFNSLNTIRGLIVEDAGVAQDMVTRLANILRYNLEREKSSTVPLQREIEIVADYLAIESIRFDDRLTVRLEIQPAAAQAQVPSMLVQTLVENAVKHGIGARTDGGEILIRAFLRDRALILEIVNSGQLTAPNTHSTQIGLINARERLRLLYGDRATLLLENRDAATVAALVSIPA